MVENVCMDVLLNTEGILQTPLPLVIFENFSESNLEFQLHFWIDLSLISSPGETRSMVRFKVDEKFKHHKIEMAFPQRDINLKIHKPLDVKVLT